MFFEDDSMYTPYIPEFSALDLEIVSSNGGFPVKTITMLKAFTRKR